MAVKPFSKALYDTNDDAKTLFINWLVSQNWKAWVNPDQYGIDVLAVTPEGEERQFEVEVKHNWRGPRFQYDTLHYSDRKLKFLKSPDTVSFVTLNHERTHALIASGAILSDAPIIVKDTIYTKSERFIEVETSQCSLVKIGE